MEAASFYLDLILFQKLSNIRGAKYFSPRLYVRTELAISFCTEKGMLNVTETVVCSISEFYWCSKRCLFSG